MLASRITAALDRRKLSTRAAGDATGFAAADFSRIRQEKLERFTVDRLMAILGSLDPAIELSVIVRPKSPSGIYRAGGGFFGLTV
jgi:predicted XRE-type DNA-binding protein